MRAFISTDVHSARIAYKVALRNMKRIICVIVLCEFQNIQKDHTQVNCYLEATLCKQHVFWKTIILHQYRWLLVILGIMYLQHYTTCKHNKRIVVCVLEKLLVFHWTGAQQGRELSEVCFALIHNMTITNWFHCNDCCILQMLNNYYVFEFVVAHTHKYAS